MSQEQELERVVIRFAGDSGDGMQLTGTEFAKAAAEAGNDISTFPDFPAEIRAPAGCCSACRDSSCTSRRSEIHTPGDAPDVLVAMNPAGAQDEPQGSRRRRHADRQHRRVHRGEPQEGRLPDEPARGRLARQVQGPRGRHLAPDDRPRSTAASSRPRRRAARRTSSRSASCSGCTAASPRPRSAASTSSSRRSRSSARRTSRSSRPAITTARPPRCSRPSTRSRRRTFTAGHVPQHHRQRGDRARPRRRRRARRQEAVLLAAIRSRPRRRSCTRSRSTRTSARSTFQAEDEIAAIGAAIGAAYGGAIAVTASSRPGHRAQGRGDRPRRDDRAAGRDRQRAARRPVDGPADEDRAERSLPGDLRPQRRVADARCSRRRARATRSTAPIEAVKIATRYMCPVMLLSATATSRTAREPWPLPNLATLPRFDVMHRTDPNGYFVYERDPRDARARMGHPRHARPRAPHRRHREGLR